MYEDAQLRLKREIQSLPMPPPEREKEYNACDCYNHMADALSGVLDPHQIEGAPEIIDSQRGWLPESDPRWGMLSQMLANYRMTLANPLANYNADGRENGTLSNVAQQIATSYSSYFAAAYHALMAYALSGESPDTRKRTLDWLFRFHAQDFRSSSATQSALIGAILGSDRMKRAAARELTAMSPFKEWSATCQLPAAIAALRKWLVAADNVGFAGGSDCFALYEPIRTVDIAGLTTLDAVFAAESRREQARQGIMKKRRAVGCCAMCGKPLSIWSRIFFAKAHTSCNQFIEDTSKT